jgi:hypothetical protein
MKNMAREVVNFHFKDTFNVDIEGGHNSDQRDEAISENVKKVIDESLFLQGPRDAQVSSLFLLAASLMLHENRAAPKTLDTLQLLTSLDAFTIMGSPTASRLSFLRHSILFRRLVSPWRVHVYAFLLFSVIHSSFIV